MEISVIIPLYKSEKYLPQLIKSLEAQTFGDFEAIFVENGATGKTPTQMFFSTIEDTRFKLYSISQKGVSNARNLGISISSGKYITFIDSDDTISDSFLEQLYLSITKNNTDIAICNFEIIRRKSSQICSYSLPSFLKSHDEVLKHFLIPQLRPETCLNVSLAVWGKLIRKSSITQSVAFPTEISVGEDFIFNLRLFQNINSLSFVRKPLYHYIHHDDSTLNQYNKNNIQTYNLFLDIYQDCLKNLRISLDEANYNLYIFLHYIFCIKNAVLGNNYIEYSFFLRKFNQLKLSPNNKHFLSKRQSLFAHLSKLLPHKIFFLLIKINIKKN